MVILSTGLQVVPVGAAFDVLYEILAFHAAPFAGVGAGGHADCRLLVQDFGLDDLFLNFVFDFFLYFVFGFASSFVLDFASIFGLDFVAGFILDFLLSSLFDNSFSCFHLGFVF